MASTQSGQSGYPAIVGLLLRKAAEFGFPVHGIVDIEPALEGDFAKHIQKYDLWLNSGYAGAMDYLVRGRDRRADPRLVFPEAKSMFCVAVPYPRRPAGAERSAQGPRYARYLQGEDYHRRIPESLEALMTEVAAEVSAQAQTASPLKWKVCVDTSAVLERSWAALCGLGWIGKNTMLIHPKYGSYLFLGEVLINQVTGMLPRPLPDYCGNCARCLNACPTQALVETRVLDSNRCVSYLTLEKRGELPVSEQIRREMGSWVAGCDICQEVCPFNTKPSRLPDSESDLGATALFEWEKLLLESESDYRDRVEYSALNRVKPSQFRRNIAIALANAASELLERDRKKIRQRLLMIVAGKLQAETDESARAEWVRCLQALGAPDRNP